MAMPADPNRFYTWLKQSNADGTSSVDPDSHRVYIIMRELDQESARGSQPQGPSGSDTEHASAVSADARSALEEIANV